MCMSCNDTEVSLTEEAGRGEEGVIDSKGVGGRGRRGGEGIPACPSTYLNYDSCTVCI